MIERSNVVCGILARLLATAASTDIDDELPSEYYGFHEEDIARLVDCRQHMRPGQTMTNGHMLASMLRERTRMNGAGDRMVLPVLAERGNV